MSSDEEKATIICSRVGETEPVTGSTTTFCHDCGAAVWIAPTSVAMITRKPQTSVRCMACTLVKAAASGEEFELRVMPETIEEAAEHIRMKRASLNDDWEEQ